MEQMRLNKFISTYGKHSRRQADLLIGEGQVKINGVRAKLGQQVNPEIDKVECDGCVIKPEITSVYYALYKPRGVVSTVSDPQGRSKVTDFVPAEPKVYPVGRLDYDSEGLIILTNDGELTNTLTHPSFEHAKKYQVKIKKANLQIRNLDEIKNLFEKGLMIDDKMMKMDQVEIENSGDYLMLDVALHTGYNRQIRKMCEKIGAEVTSLTRTEIGKLKLADLNILPGQFKIISRQDIL